MLFGGVAAPLFYVAPTQINVQVPFEIPDVSSVDLVVQNEHGASTPMKVTLLTQDPGVFSVIRQGSPVDASNPILPGDTITILATGLGSVLPPLPSGQAGPSNPAAVVAITPLVRVGGLAVNVNFAAWPRAPWASTRSTRVSRRARRADLGGTRSGCGARRGTGPPGPAGATRFAGPRQDPRDRKDKWAPPDRRGRPARRDPLGRKGWRVRRDLRGRKAREV